ncbi:peptidoglycan DD-metalloendopeptidase family protein [Hazenella sp. IB182357]|uniref:Peptidoglycan DD-metalloendopeptidase family protein n=1 Tax=Polycladospora coralii TaxID=2771432 RepID=A0A926NC39_9BACL|nr:peptidoglycan DD-metalloendopeptidase family protein [Polycladospora coralii]
MGAWNNQVKQLQRRMQPLPPKKNVGIKGVVGVVIFILPGVLFVFILLVTNLFLTLFTTPPPMSSYKDWEITSDFPAVGQKYLPIYQEAGQKYGVPWHILAAIHKVETDFGRNLSKSSVNAEGHMQFMDKTWVGWSYPGGTRLGDLPDHVDVTNLDLIKKYKGYGVDADGDGVANPYDPVDAIHAAAKYLAANYQDGEDWFARDGAIWQYNHDYENYVLKVKSYAESYAMPVQKGQDIEVAAGSFIWPLEGGRITSKFGNRFHPIKKVYQYHSGIDIGKPANSPIFASHSGVVIESRSSTGYGWKIIIDHGNGYQTLYAHMEDHDVKVRAGQRVQKGDVIALVGSNGWSTGPHLHFEVRLNDQLLDPLTLVQPTITTQRE